VLKIVNDAPLTRKLPGNQKRFWGDSVSGGDEPMWVADAHRDDGKRFVVRADEKLIPFLKLEAAIHAFSELA
jgi:hypothetical protein